MIPPDPCYERDTDGKPNTHKHNNNIKILPVVIIPPGTNLHRRDHPDPPLPITVNVFQIHSKNGMFAIFDWGYFPGIGAAIPGKQTRGRVTTHAYAFLFSLYLVRYPTIGQ